MTRMMNNAFNPAKERAWDAFALVVLALAMGMLILSGINLYHYRHEPADLLAFYQP